MRSPNYACLILSMTPHEERFLDSGRLVPQERDEKAEESASARNDKFPVAREHQTSRV